MKTNVAISGNYWLTPTKVLLYFNHMIKYTKVKVLKITDVQFQTLKKLDSYQINVAQFIRDAISEKIKRDHKNLIPKPKKEFCPF